ncbi:hypothetical protein DVH24_034797 [Malus domestica]|uniref:Uncharacterized protein n=1 Tax=Malus domestica TaxID=3750 RepID=A0A498ID50_MALDO|nr:hypothetical protein DVH24_034797 [Malus domestica]
MGLVPVRRRHRHQQKARIVCGAVHERKNEPKTSQLALGPIITKAQRAGDVGHGYPNDAGCGNLLEMVNGTTSGGFLWSKQAMVHQRTKFFGDRGKVSTL